MRKKTPETWQQTLTGSKTGCLAWLKQILAQRQCSGSSPPGPALYTDLPGLVLPKEWSRSRERARTGSAVTGQPHCPHRAGQAPCLHCTCSRDTQRQSENPHLCFAWQGGVSPTRDNPEPSGCIPVPWAVGWPCWSREVGTTRAPVASSLTHPGIHLNWWSRF